MSLNAALERERVKQPNRTRQAPGPADGVSTTDFDDSGSPKQHTMLSGKSPQGEDLQAMFEKDTGLSVPDHLEVTLERVTMQRMNDESVQYWLKLKFIPKTLSSNLKAEDLKGVLKSLPKASKAVRAKGEAIFVDNLNDTQAGKANENGGSHELTERLNEYDSLVLGRKADLEKIGYSFGTGVLLGGGDLVEGCAIYPHQAFQIDLDMEAQRLFMFKYIMRYLRTMAPLYDRYIVVVAPGNHGENRIDGKKVNRSDNADTGLFQMAKIAAEVDPALEHIEWRIAIDEPAMTVQLHDWIYTVTHGSVYGKGFTGSPAKKAQKWYEKQAAAHKPYGDAHVVVGNHFHHEILEAWGDTLFWQNPAQDCGSPDFADFSGGDCPPGRATWVVTPRERMTEIKVLR